MDAWIPGKKREGGAYERQGSPGKADDEVTVTEAAKIKGRRPPTILTAIWDGRLPARWVPREIPIAPPLTVPYTEGEQGWWLIRKEDLDAYTPLTKDEMRAKGQETHKRGERSKRKK